MKNCTYSLDPSIPYNPMDELHLSPESNKGAALIANSLAAYHTFGTQYRAILDLNDVTSIEKTYAAAQAAGIFELAQAVRKAFFANDIHFYGVTYLWDMCMESCIYCPAAIQNRKKTKYKTLALSIDDAVKDVQYIMQDGHRHICVLTGEDPLRYPPQVLAEYIRAFDQLGLKEIILNVEPPADWQDFKLWRNAAEHTALQFRVFQETYNREKYAEIHPVTKYGRKHNFTNRYYSQERALLCGFDNVGLGVLLGNHRLPIEEIDSLQIHAKEIKDKTGKQPARVCLPSAKYLETIQVNIPYSLTSATSEKNLHWKFSEIIYALARLAMPTISIVSSERDEARLLTLLDNYASCTTLNVHPGVGDNIRFHEQKVYPQIHFEQAPSFSRNPQLTIASMQSRGFRPWLASNKADIS